MTAPEPPALPLAKVDLDVLIEALEDHSRLGPWWLDPSTGSVWPDEVDVPSALDRDDWIPIEPLDSRVGFADMEDFVARVPDAAAAERLRATLGVRGSFRRFRDVLFDLDGDVRQQWLRFHDVRMRRRAVAWLAEVGVVAETEAGPALAALSDPRIEPDRDDAARARARSCLLEAFRWVDGHADFAPALREPALLEAVGTALAAPFRDAGVTVVAAVEARAFVLAPLVATALHAGLVLVRKPGSVQPGYGEPVLSEPDWRGNQVELRMPAGVVGADDVVLVVDDWVETGSQAGAARRLVEAAGARWAGLSVLVDGCLPDVRAALGVVGLVGLGDLPPVR